MAETKVLVEGTVVTPSGSAVPTKAYVLKAGKKHTHNGKSVKPGQTVELTESQAKAFADKFDAADGSGFRVTTPTDFVRLREADVEQPPSTPRPVGSEKPQPAVNPEGAQAPPEKSGPGKGDAGKTTDAAAKANADKK